MVPITHTKGLVLSQAVARYGGYLLGLNKDMFRPVLSSCDCDSVGGGCYTLGESIFPMALRQSENFMDAGQSRMPALLLAWSIRARVSKKHGFH